MKLALVFGNNTNNVIGNEIKKQKDDLVLDCFNSVDDLVNNSVNRNYIFDRILYLSKVSRVGGNPQLEIEKLANYWGTYAKSTSIIFVCKSGDDNDVAQIFESAFQSPLCTSMMVSKVSVNTLMDSINLDTLSIASTYSINGVKEYSVEVESRKPQEAPKSTKPSPAELKEQKRLDREKRHQQRQAEREAKSKDEKKQGVLGGLFGFGKKAEPKQPQQQEEQEPKTEQIPQQVEAPTEPVVEPQVETAETQAIDWEEQFEAQQAETPVETTPDISEEEVEEPEPIFEENTPDTSENDTLAFDENKDTATNFDVDAEEPSSDVFEETEPNFEEEEADNEEGNSNFSFEIDYSDNDDIDDAESLDSTQIASLQSLDNLGVTSQDSTDIFEEPTPVEQTDSLDTQEPEVETQEVDSVFEDSEPVTEEEQTINETDSLETPDSTSKEETVHLHTQEPAVETKVEASQPQEQSSLSPEEQNVIDEVEDTEFNIDFTPQRDVFDAPSAPKVDASEVESEADFGNIGKLEQSLKEKENQPKVIEKIVEKEVVKEVIRVQGGVIDAVLKGTTSKILLFTGDRGCGVTTTAFDVAKAVAKYTRVLYVDGDVTLHGLLSYIDYDEFTKYDPAVLQGMKLARKADAFWHCRASFMNNIDILSSNYDVDVTDDELMDVMSVIAEIANNYSLVVIDAPIAKLECFQDILLQANTVICCEASKRGMMNTIQELENCKLPIRYKRALAGKGTMVMTKLYKGLDMKKLLKYIMNMVILDDVKWLDMHIIPRKPEIDKAFLSDILEG